MTAALSAANTKRGRLQRTCLEIRRALIIGYPAAKTKQNDAGDGVQPEPEG
jgi:hypothetical protein